MKFMEPNRVVCQMKGIRSLIHEVHIFRFYGVARRHSDVINYVKITFLPITLVLIVAVISC